MFYLRAVGMVFGFVGASLYAIGIALVRRDKSHVARDYARAMARLMRPPLGLEVEVEGEEYIRAQRPCVYVSNHQSAYDVPVLAILYPEDTVIIGKKELRSIPLFGWLYHVTGNILIDRSSNPSSVQRLREAEQAIRERGVSVWIFPEGTRGTTPGQLLPFKKGAFYMAIAAGVPIVPVVASPIHPLFDFKRRILRPGTVQVRVLEPIATGDLHDTDAPRLMAEVRSRMQRALDELATTPGGTTPKVRKQAYSPEPGRGEGGRG
jgi:1-acyl-sn-glycerol-3-phosphate acyltransferase